MSGRLADPCAMARHRESLVTGRSSRRGSVAVCVGTGCRANGAVRVYEALRTEVQAHGGAREVVARATGCQGFCQGGPLVRLLPEDVVYQHVRVEDVPEIVEKTVLGDEVIERLLCVDPATDRHCVKEEEDPLLPRPAAPAAARQRPPRPDLHR